MTLIGLALISLRIGGRLRRHAPSTRPSATYTPHPCVCPPAYIRVLWLCIPVHSCVSICSPFLFLLMLHQPGHLVTSQDLEAAVVAACTMREEHNWKKADYRACVYIRTDYFVKYGTPEDLKPELATQEYIFAHAQQSDTPDASRVAKLYITLSTNLPCTWSWNT